MTIRLWLKEWYKIMIVIITPILLLPLPLLLQTDESKCAYAILMLLIYWITEAIPIPVTSLLPLVLFPLLGILKSNEDTAALFFGSGTLAYAIQSSDRPPNGQSVEVINISTLSSDEERSTEQEQKLSSDQVIKLRKGLILCVAYGAVYGGLSTIVGSAATIFLKAFVDEQYANTNFRITFLNYLLFVLPVVVLMMITCWLWLQIRYNYHDLLPWCFCKYRSSNDVDKQLKKTLRRQYNELGFLQWNEGIVLALFLTTVTLWTTRDLAGGQRGWNVLFRSEYVSNGTVALLISILTMILPNDNPCSKNWKYKPIISWTDLSKNYPWGTLTLLGAGLSISQAFQVSKLSNLLANALHFLHDSSRMAILVAIIVLNELCTQIVNNLSVASILFPVITTLASTTEIHPARLLLPSSLALSLGFLLPISSQPNSVIFATGYIQTRDLFTTGIMLNLLGGLIIFLASTTWMIPIFDLNQPLISSSNLTL
ncbi:unnamed protein product [Rotaria sordida]|uniref:Uncharacterized protein n=1 Tax=Rotaria sordida TaxID=392033 RepID=A0A819AYG4_9BILA|nr:unnamed protein product [Rotaria sordida]